MIRLTNASSKPRTLPNGVTVPPGVSVGVDFKEWERDSAIGEMPTLLRKGLLVEFIDLDAAAAGAKTELDEADILIAKLAKHGIVKTRRSSVESLAAALEKAESAAGE
jgi:RNase P/RNase MRP subunit POP5